MFAWVLQKSIQISKKLHLYKIPVQGLKLKSNFEQKSCMRSGSSLSRFFRPPFCFTLFAIYKVIFGVVIVVIGRYFKVHVF